MMSNGQRKMIYFPQRREGAKRKFSELCVFASWRENLRVRGFFHCANVAVLAFFFSGCDPILNIGGTFFPGWMVAILIGSALTVAIRYIFVFTRLEPHVGPLALIYTSLGLLLSVISWLILYRG